MKEIIKQIEMRLSFFGYSKYKYLLPVVIVHPQFYFSSPAHKGRFKHAVDIAVPDPKEKRTVILSPIDGTIEALVMGNTKWGSTSEFRKYMNYVHIRIDNESHEFVELVHIDTYVDERGVKHPLRIGDKVKMGQPIAIAALNGWITADENKKPDSHVHMLVGEWLNQEHTDFRSLKIRWR